MDEQLLKTRVKNLVRFKFFCDNTLYYEYVDGFTFPIPIADTTNSQGGSPTFNAEEKGIYLMRWIRKEMEQA